MTVIIPTPNLIQLDPTPTGDEEAELFANIDEHRQRLELVQQQDDIQLRRDYAKCAKDFAEKWVCFSMLATVIQFTKPYGWQLKSAEFIAIVATALATVVALYMQVGLGMFKTTRTKK